MKSNAWIQSYERNNVLVGLQCALRGKVQIGKGMWAIPVSSTPNWSAAEQSQELDNNA